MKLVPIAIVIPFKRKENSTEIWMQKRVSSDELGGYWEFPGGKIEENELIVDACIREIREETSVSMQNDRLIRYQIFPRKLFDKIINLNIYLYEVLEDSFAPEGWFQISTEEDLLALKILIPPDNYIFLTQIFRKRDFKNLSLKMK